MKTNRIIITLLCFLLGFALCAQTPSVSSKGGKLTEVVVPGYKLFPTENMWIFLKLDTSKGLVSMVQYSMEEKNRMEIPINYMPFALGTDAIPGRFNLYPTQNMWTFILLDEVDGRTWQVQWSTDGKEGILDSRAFYAAKTASDGTDRYIWGWCPYRIGSDIHEKNINVGADSEPAWSGALVCHKIIQHPDGTLTVGAVPALDAKYNQSKEVTILENGDGFTLYNRLGAHNHISFTATTEDKFGVSLVRGSDSKKYYTMVVNPEDGGANRKINFEQEGEEGKGFIEGVDGYKFASPADKKYKVDIYTDNSVVVMYINDVCAYTNRIYGIQKNCWSINTYDGEVNVENIKVSQY